MENTAGCMGRQNDECRKSKRTNRKDIVAVSHSLKYKGGGGVCGKFGPVQMSTGCIIVVRKKGRKEKWVTEDAMGRHVQQGSRRAMVKNSQKPERME